MATTLSSPLPDPGGCLICQRLALAVVLVDLANTSKEIIPCFSITARFAGSHRSLRPDTARLPVQSVPVAIRQRQLADVPQFVLWIEISCLDMSVQTVYCDSYSAKREISIQSTNCGTSASC